MSQANNPSAIISTERVFSVPRRRVFAAFEQPDQLARWWGAEGFHELVRAVGGIRPCTRRLGRENSSELAPRPVGSSQL
jgi:uncharacterized protein YndB with AHSA1/START domain